MDDFAVFDNFSDNPILFEDDQVCAVGFFGNIFKVEVGTTFVAVASGELMIDGWPHLSAAVTHSSLRQRLIGAGMYACVPAPATFTALGCCAMLATVKSYKGIFMLGGPIEETGRLCYINGCTDTGLIQPLRLGDPCLNYLHFPAATLQDSHFHPSHRIGLVYGGRGLCHTHGKVTPLLPRSVFVIPSCTSHFFETTSEALRIVAFHPDSEFGPTDESHQMLNATLSTGP